MSDVLLFLPDLDGGGAQRTFVNLANEFSNRGVDVTLAVARADGPAREWLNPSVCMVDLSQKRTRNAVLPLLHLLNNLRPNTLLSTLVDANIVATMSATLSLRKPRLILRESNSHRARGDIRWLRRQFIGWSYSRADLVIALSSGVGRELTIDYRLDPDKVVTIGNPINVDLIARQAAFARKRCVQFSGSERPVLCAIGRLTRQKGFDVLLEALTQCQTDPTLLVIGDGRDRDRLADQAISLGLSSRVHFAGL